MAGNYGRRCELNSVLSTHHATWEYHSGVKQFWSGHRTTSCLFHRASVEHTGGKLIRAKSDDAEYARGIDRHGVIMQADKCITQ